MSESTVATLSARHRKWVASAFGDKVQELHFFLEMLVDACDRSLEHFLRGEQIPETNRRTVVFAFSAFANAVLSLKDGAETIVARPGSLSRPIRQLEHGDFMLDARNAATHDGHPIVSAWANGRYFVSATIVRLAHGKLVEIPAPTEDLRTVCLQFTAGLCQLLRTVLADSGAATDLEGPLATVDEVDEALAQSPLIPAFVRQLAERNRDHLDAILRAQTHDPVAGAIAALDAVSVACADLLRLDPASAG
jgi:hypothetical protein